MFLSFTNQHKTLDIGKAISKKELYMALQPKVGLKNGSWSVTGAEALLRWDHKEHGAITPEIIIKAAVQQNLMQELTNYCITWVLQHLKTLPQDENFTVALNVDPIAFNQELVDFIKESLLSHTIKGSKLQIELTESSPIRDFKQAQYLIDQLKKMGICVYLDDFGTGYASLQYLSKITFDGVKIDKSFVTRAPYHFQDRLILTTIIQLATSLECDVVVEGVETKDHLDLLQSLGVTCIQGYYFSKPLKIESFSSCLNTNKMLTTTSLSA
jgi:EAL domain-containing protein (putative c-di-GMP-specific phosphodiesterase class I)